MDLAAVETLGVEPPTVPVTALGSATHRPLDARGSLGAMEPTLAIIDPHDDHNKGTQPLHASSHLAVSCAAAHVQARAHCGPAHGHPWTVDPDAGPAPVAVLPTRDEATSPYRLIAHPRSLRPACDHQGRYLYLPVRSQPTPRPR